MKSIEARISYYAKKVAQYGEIHFSKRRNPHRQQRLLNYRKAMHKQIADCKGRKRMKMKPCRLCLQRVPVLNNEDIYPLCNKCQEDPKHWLKGIEINTKEKTLFAEDVSKHRI